MNEALALIILIAASVATVLVYRNIRIRRAMRRRLGMKEDVAEDREALERPSAGPFVRSRPWLAYLGGVFVGVVLYFFVGLTAAYAATLGFIAGLLGAQLEQLRVERRIALIEAQLADALDLMISALSAGTGVSQALETAARESRAPLRPQLEILVNRVRLGDDPQAVLRALESNVPLATFRLFAAVLSVHWEVGGSLTGPLAMVARTIRDRIELGRRIRSLTTQSRASIGAVLLTTYFIALVMWRTDPQRMGAFLATMLGQWIIISALILQALGIVWSSRLSRLRI